MRSASSPSADDGDTWLVGQWRYPLGLYSWEIPEGGGPVAGPLLESAQRELVGRDRPYRRRWTDLGPFHLSNSVTNEEGHIFLAQGLTFGHAEPEGDEVLDRAPSPVPRSLSQWRWTDASRTASPSSASPAPPTIWESR